MSRIHVLPEHVANQIAAGEVVERPASVVKELFENALDAGAMSISIAIEQGGRRRIRVADDGGGMDREEAVLAFERHATSKLRDAADLVGIETLGFRGEALPAIASVSRLTLTTCDGTVGSRVEVEAGRIIRCIEAGHPRGTTVDVQDLFFNTPARARFLRSPSTEMSSITDFVEGFAAALPGVRILLEHDGKRILELTPVATHEERIAQIHGDRWRKALPVSAEVPGLRLHGLLAPPDPGAATRRTQHFHVNGRMVKDRIIAHAVTAATGDFLPKGRHAELFVFLEISGPGVDVNVHPAKAEVRFRDSRSVHEVVYSAIRATLARHIPLTPFPASGVDDRRGSAGFTPPGQSAAAVGEAISSYMGRESRTQASPARECVEWTDSTRLLAPPVEDPRLFGQYRNTYILASDREGLLLIDQHAAHERIVFEQLMGQDENGGFRPTQDLLFPVVAPLPRPLREHVDEAIAWLLDSGISAERMSEESLVIRSAPAVIEASALPELLSDLLEQMTVDGFGREQSMPAGKERLLATVACHASVRAGMPLTPDKMNYLINALFQTATPLKCPHGRPSILRLSEAAIEKGFDRR